MRGLEGGLGKQDAVVGDDAHLHALDARKTGDQRGAVARLELIKLAAIDDAGNDFAHIKRFAGVHGNHAIQLVCCKFRELLAHDLRALEPCFHSNS